jgi:hypothetical protein
MPTAKQLTPETGDFSDSEEVDVFLEQIMSNGILRVREESARLEALGLMDSDSNLLATELPSDMREGSERDFGG